jgi:ribosomal protein S19E (S16A)
MRGKVGVNTLRKHYGKKQNNGTCTEHSRIACGKNIRYALQQLEAAGLVGKVTYEGDDSVLGKMLTKKGTTDMDRIASQIAKDAKGTVKK